MDLFSSEIFADLLKIFSGALIPIFLKLFTDLASNIALNWRLAASIRDLRRHLAASKESVRSISSYPVYKIISRIKYCSYFEGSMIQEDRARIAKKRSHLGMELLLRIRNYDIFIDEVAKRVDQLSESELTIALSNVEKNIEFLEAYLDKHKLSIKEENIFKQVFRLASLY